MAGRGSPEIRQMKKTAVYIIINNRNGTLYTGVTSNLIQGIYQHKLDLIEGFTKKYDYRVLVFYGIHTQMESAIIREKQIKSGLRNRKIKFIEDMNPNCRDLYGDIV